jgi:hypothetical protein
MKTDLLNCTTENQILICRAQQKKAFSNSQRTVPTIFWVIERPPDISFTFNPAPILLDESLICDFQMVTCTVK